MRFLIVDRMNSLYIRITLCRCALSIRLLLKFLVVVVDLNTVKCDESNKVAHVNFYSLKFSFLCVVID